MTLRRCIVLGLGLLVLFAPVAAHGAVVNDYTASDDVWNAPIAPRHFLLDTRSSFAPFVAGPFAQPQVSLVWGIRPGLEAGLFSAYAWSAVPRATPLAAVAPYLKAKLPYHMGATSFGLVAGFQVPTGGSDAPPTAGLEGVAIVPLNKVWELHAGLGAGGDFAAGTWLGHGNLALNWTLPSNQSLFAEAFTNLSGAAAPVYGERLGVLAPLGTHWSLDASVGLGEGPAGLTGFSPQIGATLTL